MRLCVPDHSLLVPPHLQELYDMYMRELDERKLDRAMALDKVTTRHTIKVTNMKKVIDTITHRYINEVAATDLDKSNGSALVSRRALYPGSPSLVRVVTTCRTWTQTRRVCVTCALTTGAAKPKSAGTPCPPFCLSLSCKRTSCQLIICLPFGINRKAVLTVILHLCFAHLRDSNRVFKNSPHARQMKNSAVMTPPPIHINGKGNREVRTILTGSIYSGLFQFNSYLRAASCCELIQSVHFKQCGLLFELNSHLTRVADFSFSPTQRHKRNIRSNYSLWTQAFSLFIRHCTLDCANKQSIFVAGFKIKWSPSNLLSLCANVSGGWLREKMKKELWVRGTKCPLQNENLISERYRSD